MTDLLKDTLTTQAADAEPPELDLDAIIAQGNRRLRHRRARTFLATAVVALAVVAAGLTAVRLTGDDAQQANQPQLSFTERRSTYALNGMIHFGDATIATGAATIQRFVQTESGFVFLDGSQIKLADGRTTRKLADAATDSPLVASGPLAGWEERTAGGSRTIVKNLRTDQVVYDVNHPSGLHSSPPGLPTGGLVAIDGETAYLASAGGGLFQVDLRTGKGAIVRSITGVLQPVTVAAGRYIYLSKGPENVGRYVSMKSPVDQVSGQALVAYSGRAAEVGAAVSTKGSSVAVEVGPTLNVYDGAGRLRLFTGARLKTFGQWLTDTTFTALDAPTGSQPVNLLTCTMSPAGPIDCRITTPRIAASAKELVFLSN